MSILNPSDNPHPTAPGGGDTPNAAERMRFLAYAGHELRSPLDNMVGLIELAARVPSSEIQARYLELAARGGHSLLRLLNEAIELARLGVHDLPAQLEWFDPDEVLADAMRSITPALGWGDFSVVYDFDGEAAQLRGDAARLQQIVVNLLGQAVAATERGHIGVRGVVRRNGAQECELRVFVEDTGAGIAPRFLPGLFEPFGITEMPRLAGRVGLGLSLVRAMVDSLGGRIDVQSVVGQGTTFELVLTLPSRSGGPAPAPAVGGHAGLFYAPPFVEGGEWLARRLQRLGWTYRLLPTLADAVEHTRSVPTQMLLVAAHSLRSATDLQALAAALPASRLVLLTRPDWRHPELEQSALDLGGAVFAVPLARRDLQALASAALA